MENNNRKEISVTRPSLPPIDDFINEVKPIFENHILTNMGPVYKKFHAQLKEFLGVPEVSLFANGHFSLELAIQALGIKEKGEEIGGGEIITTPFTFVSTTHAICRNNLKPVFCDIRRDNYCIDADKIEELITDKTVAIIPVHVYGNVCDIEKIDNISKKYKLKVIYDGAHAFGEKYCGKGIGNYGDATMFSFHATKVFNCIEGGAITFNDEQYRKPLHELKNFGISGSEQVDSIGCNAKLDEFRAAMGICNLKRMDECLAARKKAFDRYMERLKGVEGIKLYEHRQDVEINYAYFPVYFDSKKFGKNRDDVFSILGTNKVSARKYFYPAINELACYQELNSNETPIAHDVSTSILCLPLYEELTLDDVDRICDIILE